MAGSGMPYRPDLAFTAEIEDSYSSQPRDTGWFRWNDAVLDAVQRHARATPRCLAVSLLIAGTGFGDMDCELIEMEGPEYWAWTWWGRESGPPTGGRSSSGLDLRAALSALRSQSEGLRRIDNSSAQGRLKTLFIATPEQGEWLIRRSNLRNEPDGNTWESVAATTFQCARETRSVARG